MKKTQLVHKHGQCIQHISKMTSQWFLLSEYTGSQNDSLFFPVNIRSFVVEKVHVKEDD